MDTFFPAIVHMLTQNKFSNYPTRRQFTSDVAFMMRDGHLVVVHGPYKSEYDLRRPVVMDEPIVSQFDPEQNRFDAIQHEFDQYLEQEILPIIDLYSKKFGLKSTHFVMPDGALKLPVDFFTSRGIKVITDTKPQSIRIDIPGTPPLLIKGEYNNSI